MTSFEETWVPRIGKEATRLARMSAYAVILLGIGGLILAALTSEFLYSGQIVPGAICVFLIVLAFLNWMRLRMKLQTALSNYFNMKIGFGNFPPINRVEWFDAWYAKQKK
jgi:hypothetical protein